MRIVAIADLHGRIENLDLAGEDLERVDLVVLTGDITNFGRRLQAVRMLEPIQARSRRLLAVPGNCDYPEVEGYLTELGINLDRSCRQFGGRNFLGLGGSLPGPVPTPNEYDEDQLAQFLKAAHSQAAEGLDSILISHQPPLDTAADQVSPGQHVGSRSVRQFIDEHQPLLCLTGHIHEAASIDRIGSTHIVNPGPLAGGHYAHIELAADGAVAAELRGPGP